MKIKTMVLSYWWVLLLSFFLFILLSFVIGNIRLKQKISNQKEKIMSQKEINQSTSEEVITLEDLNHLPMVVRKWLIEIGVVGKKRIHLLEFSQKGTMKLDPEKDEWISSEAKQYVNVKNPGFLWHVDLQMMPLLKTKGKDFLYQGEASMEVYIAALIPVVNVKDNKKTDESSLSRFLLELPLYPTAALEEYMTWQAVNEGQAKGTLTYKGTTVTANFYFGDNNRLEKVEALRYKENDRQSKKIPCIGELKSYETFNGIEIPNTIEISWLLENEIYTWYKFEVPDYKVQ